MTGLGALKKLAQPATPLEERVTDEHCEFCAAAMGERHGHVADVDEHRLMCVCRPCYLLFATDGAGGARFKGVGEDVRRVAGLRMRAVDWDALRIPVDLAFFFRQTGAEDLLAFYPGPGGATESLLDLSAWADIAAANPVLETCAADVEALLLRRGEGGFGCYLVPIDVCYELVGTVRTWWTGLGGGPEVAAHIDEFFADLDARARLVPAAGEPS